jgi:DNA-binding transcriptional MerR regulator
MTGETYQVSEVALMTNITVRTLHHYDTIGLLVPSGRTEAGYRLYSNGDLIRLQQVLLYREFGLSLERIRNTLDDPGFDQHDALLQQRKQLVQRSERNEAMIRAVDCALRNLTEDQEEMDTTQLFDGFDPGKYADETQTRWGHTDPYKEAQRRTKGYSEDDWKRIKAENNDLMARTATLLSKGESADGDEAMDLAEAHRLHFDPRGSPKSGH